MNGQVNNQKKSECVLNVKVPTGIERKCNRCGIIKPINKFYPELKNPGKYYYTCKKCRIEERYKWRRNNREKYLESRRISYQKNHERELLRKRKWRADNYERNTEQGRLLNRKRRLLIHEKLNNNFGNSMRRSLKCGKNGYHWEKFVDYNLDQLKIHLEKQFKNGMTWDNYGKWHIDHKLPLSAFNINSPEDIDFKKCWALSNLQPLWALDNISKGAKLLKPFQPSLLLSL